MHTPQKIEIDPQNLLNEMTLSVVSSSATCSRIDSLIGKQVAGKYEILSLLGSSSTSSVYLVKHEALNKVMALKMIHPHLALDEKTVLRFQREAQAASLLDHPNIISVHDFGITNDGNPYLVMDYIQGTNLAVLLNEKEKLTPEISIHIISQVCSALEHAHHKGIIHRDLKPSNIMIVQSELEPNFVKIVDFGIAKFIREDSLSSQKLTHTGEVFGTPLYMSPEQCLGQKLDARTDIYSLGCVLYECLTGKQPLVGDTAYETIGKQINEIPAGLGNTITNKQLRAALEIVVFRTLAKDRTKRYKSMNHFKDDLDLIARGNAKSWFTRLANILYLQQLKCGPIYKKIPTRIIATSIVLFIIFIGLFSWFLGLALRPEHNNYYQYILWETKRLPNYVPPTKLDAEVGTRIRTQLMNLMITARPDIVSSEDFQQPAPGRLLNFTNSVLKNQVKISLSNKQTVKVLQDLADDLWRDGYYQIASLAYQEAATGQLHLKNDQQALKFAQEDLNRMSLYLVSQNRWPELFDTYSQLAHVWYLKPASERDPDQLRLFFCRYADICHNLNSFIASEKEKQNKLQLAETLLIGAMKKNISDGNFHESTALPEIALAILYRHEGKLDKAYKQYKQAYLLLEKTNPNNKRQYAIFLGNYGDFLWETKHYQESIEAKLRSAMLKLSLHLSI